MYLRIVLIFSFRSMAEGDWCRVSLSRRSPRHNTHYYTHVLLHVAIHHSAYTYPRQASSVFLTLKAICHQSLTCNICVKILIYYTTTSFKLVLTISYTCNSLYQGLLPLQIPLLIFHSKHLYMYIHTCFPMERKKKPGFVRCPDLLQVNCFIYRNWYCLPFSSVKNSVLQYYLYV